MSVDNCWRLEAPQSEQGVTVAWRNSPVGRDSKRVRGHLLGPVVMERKNVERKKRSQSGRQARQQSAQSIVCIYIVCTCMCAYVHTLYLCMANKECLLVDFGPLCVCVCPCLCQLCAAKCHLGFSPAVKAPAAPASTG